MEMHETSPFFSVILPVYNREKLILRAVESVCNQQFQSWELLIIDDASTDETWNVVQSIQDSRIRIFRNQINLERCVSRNRGILEAKGEYIAFLDSDDYHLPDHLKTIHDVIQQSGSPRAMFFSKAWNESEEGVRTARICPDFNDHNPYAYFLRYTVNPQRWAVHRSIFSTVQFDPDINICEDMDTSLRIARAGFPIFEVPHRTTVYVEASDSFTHGDPKKWEREFDALMAIFKRPELKSYLPKIEMKRLLSMCHYHLAVKAAFKSNRKFWYHASQSVLLFPKGYNGKTLKPLLGLAKYHIPFVGVMLRKFINPRLY